MTARIIMKLKVEAARRIGADVLHVRLVHPRRPELPAWRAGAHVDLHLPDGRIRQYSLCGDPAERRHYDIAIKREDGGRGGSRWAHEAIRAGCELHVSAPRTNFALVPDAGRHLLVAGGIGVTPMLAMAHELNAAGAAFAVHFCARSRAEAPLLSELAAACGARLSVWASSQGRRFDPEALGGARRGTHVYLCGPQRLVAPTQAALAATGWAADQIHLEAFQATVDENFKPEPFDAVIGSTGQTLHVPADRSLLEILRGNGFALPASCENGVCGSCECGYRAGTVIHRDKVLPLARRQDRLMPCVSRARVAVTLDL